GYFDSPDEAIPNVPLTFYSFHIMVILGGILFAVIILVGFFVYRTEIMQKNKWMQWIAMLSIPLVWICSESGWITAEVGRQPWLVQDLMPSRAAISAISSGQVQLTFWIFAVLFTIFLVAEICILLNYINKQSKLNIDNQ
ncbi:MAG: cytochrome ubiquinol oxidase subunit I, partial [Muribaculaceae bacterium]|nr:cytochrome ubiquinol oxidase subunit I [Muribaculaceae bacterium]